MRLPAELRQHTAFRSRAWGSGWSLHAVLSSCRETSGLLQPHSLLRVQPFPVLLLRLQGHLHPGSLYRCTREAPKYPPSHLETCTMSSTKAFSDKNMLEAVSLSDLLLAGIRGDGCSALTLEQLPRGLWIQCQIRREASSARHGTHAQRSKVQHLHSSWLVTGEGSDIITLLKNHLTLQVPSWS